MEVLATINLEDIPEKVAQTYRLRPSARAVVFDYDNNIGLLHVSADDYWKLPGGGIEEGEEVVRGLERECEEELGCDIEVGDEIGQINEIRSKYKEYQESYVFFAKVVGEKGQPNFDEGEKELGFEIHWMTLAAAIEKLEQCKQPPYYMGKYVTKRDLIILKKAKELLA